MCASKREESQTAGGKEERPEKRYMYMHERLKTFAYLNRLNTSSHLLARVQHYDTS